MKKIAIATLVIAAGGALAQSQSYSGTTVGGPLWNRPIGAGPSISGLGPVNYHAETLNLIPGVYDFSSLQDGGWDGYLHVYAGGFDANNQLVGLLAGDDDGNGGIGTSDIEGLNLAGGTYVVVTSGFQAGDAGTFTNTITLVPTPASAALLGLGGLAAIRRRR